MRTSRPLLALAGAAALAACASVTPNQTNAPLTPTEQYSIQVRESPDQVGFTVHPDGLSQTQRAALAAFAARWRETPDRADIAVQVPMGGDGPAARTADEVTAGLVALGVPTERIRNGDYQAPAGAPVLASFARLEARGPDCSGGWDNLTSTGSNRATAHFGCAEVANIAAQIADPRDLLAPAASQPGDAARRDTVLGKYRKGEVTSTARDVQAQGAVTRTVGSQ